MYFKRKELEKFRRFKGPLIDVRSPGEYYKGHMPNSINIPLFDNDERSIIGTIYKNEGRKKAVIEGLNFFEKKMELLLDNLFMSIKSYKTIPNKNNEYLINLASAEYFKSINIDSLKPKLINIIFKEKRNGSFKIIGIHAKKARGLMSRYIIKNKISNPEKLKKFNYEKYKYNSKLSSSNDWVFTR